MEVKPSITRSEWCSRSLHFPHHASLSVLISWHQKMCGWYLFTEKFVQIPWWRSTCKLVAFHFQTSTADKTIEFHAENDRQTQAHSQSVGLWHHSWHIKGIIAWITLHCQQALHDTMQMSFLHFHRTHSLVCNHRNLILNTVHFGRSAFIASNIQVFLALVNARSLCFLPTNNFEVRVANLTTTHTKIIRFLMRTSIEFVMSETGCWWHQQHPLRGQSWIISISTESVSCVSSTETDITWEVEIQCWYELLSKKVHCRTQNPITTGIHKTPASNFEPSPFQISCCLQKHKHYMGEHFIWWSQRLAMTATLSKILLSNTLSSLTNHRNKIRVHSIQNHKI